VIELFDSHCHLTDAAFRDDREAVLLRAHEAGVTRLVTIASNVADARAALELARATEGVWCTAGVHPHEARHGSPEALERVRDALTSEPRLRAVGECGLDYHYDHSPRATQRAVFRAQLEMAAELGRPVVVHCREAEADVVHLVREHKGSVTGVLHCFSGGNELLEVGLDAGWYVSFAGVITFKRFDGGDLLRAVPRDRLLVETDSPYLAPVPNRGQRNEPSYVVRVAEAVARLREETVEEVAAYTAANARTLFGI
jgi:TatD DNase family protein